MLSQEAKCDANRHRVGRAALVAAIALGGALIGSSCGGDADDERAAVRTVAQVQRAFAAGNIDAVCAGMTPAARKQAGAFAHGRPGACGGDLREAFAVAMPNAVRGTRPPPRVGGAVVDGSRASATAEADAGGRFQVPLERSAGRWRIASFFGTAPSAAKAAAAAGGRRPYPAASDGEAVEIADETGLPCFPLIVDSPTQVGGGCTLTVQGDAVRLLIDTPFGRYDFGKCTLLYRVAAGPTGRAWTIDQNLDSPYNNGCADFLPCTNTAGENLPWKGRITAAADGGFRHEMAVCLDTCVGFYAGKLVLRLERRGGRWVVIADGARVGESGLALYGRMGLEPASTRLRRAAES